MKVKDAIKQLKKMPQDAVLGYRDHDMDGGDSSPVSYIEEVTEAANTSGDIQHRVVVSG